MLSLARHVGRRPPSRRSKRICSRFSTSITSTADADADADADDATVHDAIIVGGGPTGLLLSALLSSYNVKSHLLFDKRPVEELLKHPQAHFINVRSMEILQAEVPTVYEGVLNEMPEVGEWDAFHFGGSVIGNEGRSDGWGGRRLGRVVHPVREPLRVGQSGHAILVPKGKSSSGEVDAANCGGDAPIVSSCRPGHLAQNKFVSLLLREARRHFDMKDANGDDDDASESSNHHLRYGEEVVEISEHKHPSDIITIQTSEGHSYHTRYLLAADGVHSFTRKHYGIPMRGDPSLQNLINVHFRTNDNLSKLLMQKSDRAMLHFVYNSQLVGAFVCHDGNEGEWVLQIPFFPPFQTLEDFGHDKVREMIWAGLGVQPSRTDSYAGQTNDLDLEILSIRPWTMSSLVAQSYVNDAKNVALVGDAAHAFPPAGGFGMNTGLQDAHNLAWRMALMLNREKGATNSDASFSDSILSTYDQERRPVASQNAALSVRNYQRTLRIAKACYLDAQHPQLLISMLGAPPMSFLPLRARKDMFRRLVDVAMMPLGSLVSSTNSGGRSFHANHIEKNVRSILESGGSLPLVFPSYELGFSYCPDDTLESDGVNRSSDTAGYIPRLKVGHRMPHILVEVLDSESTTRMSLADISSQWRRSNSLTSPTFTLIAFGPFLSKEAISLVGSTMKSATKTANVPILLANVQCIEASADDQQIGFRSDVSWQNESQGLDVVYAVDTQLALLELLRAEQTISCNAPVGNDEELSGLIMVRPDGHVANVSQINWGDAVAMKSSDLIHRFIEQGLCNAMGDAATQEFGMTSN